MNDVAVTHQSLAVLVRMLQSGEASAVDVMRGFLARISLTNPQLNAIVSLQPEGLLLDEAKAADALCASGAELGALHGVPIAVKDLEAVAGMRFTSGSPACADHVAEADSVMVARFRAAGAIIIGKTNVPEFGLGSHTFNPVFGVTRNPYDTRNSAGGSSGGAAAALAARMVPVADGSDAMGSLRNPAAYCSIYGFRPTPGLIPDTSCSGTAPHERLSTLGPMARTVEDLALLLDVQSGAHPRDPFSWSPSRPFSSAILDGAPKTMRIGWLADYGGSYTYERGVRDLCESCLTHLTAHLGAHVTTVTPSTPAASLWNSWTTLRSAQKHRAGGLLADLYSEGATRAMLKPEAIWEVERGMELMRAKDGEQQLARARLEREAWRAETRRLFEEFDLLALPAAACFPFPAEQRHPTSISGRQMDTYHRWMEVVVPASLAALPALCVPAGFSDGGLPIGMQLIGAERADALVLAVGHAYCLSTRFHLIEPRISVTKPAADHPEHSDPHRGAPNASKL